MSMTRPTSPRLLVAREDDPLFDADHSRCSGPSRRASISVAEVKEIARRAVLDDTGRG
ncbi:hypothetical protein [Streptomyces sp. MS2.AVA.5]|uniref:Uncharacterized protein n=1 Tax=Streptomyces achmelvichensis TaxID=3134111 RepID=A0ACC6PKX8_9ACTN